MKNLIHWLVPLVLSACSGAGGSGVQNPGTAAAPYGVEVIVRTGENFRSEADVKQFVESAAQNRVSVIHVLVKQDEDGNIGSGHAYYASAIAPVAPGYAGFDVLATMLTAAHARQIKVWAWIPQFHDQVAALRQPEWQMRSLQNGQVQPFTGKNQREFFVNPLHPQVQDYELSIIAEVVSRYPVDGITLDWIRFDDYNMDLGPVSLSLFQARHPNVDPLRIDFSRASPERELWNEFRTDGIAAYTQRVRKALPPDLPLGLFALPPEFVEVGQDAGKFSHQLKMLSPMCYYLDWGYPLQWLWSSCMRSAADKAGSTAVVPAMDSRYTDADYQSIFSHLRSDFPQIRSIAWFYHGRWDAERMRRIAALP